MASPQVARVTLTGEGLGGSLRPYQAEAVTAITAGLRDRGRAQLRAACGTGKTYIASTAAAELLAGGGVVVVLVPSIALAAQTITAWQAGCPADQVLAVCSDYTVGGGGVRAADLAVPVTTDAEMIAKWLADTSGRALLVGTYDSAHRLAEGLRRAGQVAELVVCDEAHRLAGAAGKTTAAILRAGVPAGTAPPVHDGHPQDRHRDIGRRDAAGHLDGRRADLRPGRLHLPLQPGDRRGLAEGLPAGGRRDHRRPGQRAARRRGRRQAGRRRRGAAADGRRAGRAGDDRRPVRAAADAGVPAPHRARPASSPARCPPRCGCCRRSTGQTARSRPGTCTAG